MGLFGSIGKVFSKITSVVDKVTSFLNKPLEFLTKPLQGLVDGVLSKLPFGIGNFIKPFADTFLSNAVGWLAGGPLGGVLSTLSNVAGVANKVDSVMDTVNGALNGGLASLPQAALQNAQNAFAFTQAQELQA